MPNGAVPEFGALNHRGTRAVQRLVEYAPATGGLALWVRHEDLPDDDPAAPPLDTDGSTLRYRPAFERLRVEEQAGRVAHAVLHVALRHAQRFLALRGTHGDPDLKLFNTCADAIVNSALADCGWLALPAGAPTLDGLLAGVLGVQAEPAAALLAWDVERLYHAVDDRRPRQGRAGREDGPKAARVRALGGPGRGDLAPAEGDAQAPHAEAERAREWRERLVRAHANDGAFSLLRTLLADLPGPRTPWAQVLRTVVARALARQPSLTWSRPARSYLAHQGRMGSHRMPFEPGTHTATPAPRLVLMVDVSGSVDDTLMRRFAREIEALVRRADAGLVLVAGDDRVRHVQRFEPGRADLGLLKFEGGGGTDFTPLLEEADRHRPDLGIVLTDLDGPAHWRPPWPVLWAVPASQRALAPPFGRQLVLD
jgi:hypothetical protein